MACKPGSAASNTALPSPRPPQGSTIASRSTPPSSDDKMLASDLQNCDRLAQQQSDAAMTLTPVAPVSVLSPILLLNDLNKRKQEEGINLWPSQISRDSVCNAGKTLNPLPAHVHRSEITSCRTSPGLQENIGGDV